MQRTVPIDIRFFVHQKQLDDCRLHAAYRNVERCHLSVMRKKVGVSQIFKHKEGNYFGGHVFDCQMEVGLTNLF